MWRVGAVCGGPCDCMWRRCLKAETIYMLKTCTCAVKHARVLTRARALTRARVMAHVHVCCDTCKAGPQGVTDVTVSL